MKLESIRTQIAAREEQAKANAPEACAGCQNLGLARNEAGEVRVTCRLTETGTDMQNRSGEASAEGVSGTARWLKYVISGSDLSGVSNENEARALRNRIGEANDACPIIANVVERLPGAESLAPIDLTPPAPLIPG